MLDIPNLQKGVILAPFTTYKIGGPAEFFVEVRNVDELVHAVKQARNAKIAYFILGTGANILIRDKGIRGLVIRNLARNFEFLPGNLLKAESGVVLSDLIQEAYEKRLSGLEHFVGIPSSVGGTIWQNLHFLNPDRTGTTFIEEIIASARILDKENNIKEVNKDFFEFGYDDSIIHHQEVVVLDVTFRLIPKPQGEIRKIMDANMAWRVAKQPQLWEYPCCGSVFKKIEGAGAGRLIEKAGLKGKQLGGVKVSEKHANYLINVGNATAADVIALIELIQKEVKQETGYELQPEIRIVGEK